MVNRWQRILILFAAVALIEKTLKMGEPNRMIRFEIVYTNVGGMII